jgi:hypothetical protein
MRIARSPTLRIVDRSGAIEIVAPPILRTAGRSGSIQILPSPAGRDDGGSGAMVIDRARRTVRRLAPAAVHAVGRFGSADRHLPIAIRTEPAMRREPAAPHPTRCGPCIASDPDLPIPIFPIPIFPIPSCTLEILPIATWIATVILPSPICTIEILPIPIARDPDLPIEKILILPTARHSAGLRRRR